MALVIQFDAHGLVILQVRNGGVLCQMDIREHMTRDVQELDSSE